MGRLYLRCFDSKLAGSPEEGRFEWLSDEISVDEVTSLFVLSLQSWREKITRY
jgi:hypothetical protein